jgi:hypothetical protein
VTFADLLAEIIGQLDRAGVPYMVTGSIASSYHGEPRATRDIDIVIDPRPDALNQLVDGLRTADFYVDPGAAREALDHRSQFNAVAADASKIDLIVRRDRPFSIEEFGRRERADLLGTPGFIVTAEDLILAKLEWWMQSGSDRQLNDAAGIIAVTPDVDERYIERWAEALGVEDGLRRIRETQGN